MAPSQDKRSEEDGVKHKQLKLSESEVLHDGIKPAEYSGENLAPGHVDGREGFVGSSGGESSLGEDPSIDKGDGDGGEPQL